MSQPIREMFSQNTSVFTQLLKGLVEIESPSTDKACLDRLGLQIIQELKKLDAEI